MAEDNKVRDTIDAVKDLADAVPIYSDLVQPAAKEVGQDLGVIAKKISPLKLLIWGWEQIEQRVLSSVEKKLENVPEARIQTPDPQVAVPAFEALRYTADKSELRDMYTNLLSKSMDEKTVRYAHPSFVQIIKDLTPDEAKLLKVIAQVERTAVVDIRVWTTKDEDESFTTEIKTFSSIGQEIGCEYPFLTPSYLENLNRLGLIRIPNGIFLKNEEVYSKLENDKELDKLKSDLKPNQRVEYIRKIAEISMYGKQFSEACMLDHDDFLESI